LDHYLPDNRKALVYFVFGPVPLIHALFPPMAHALDLAPARQSTWAVMVGRADPFELLDSPTKEDLRKWEEFGARFGELVGSI